MSTFVRLSLTVLKAVFQMPLILYLLPFCLTLRGESTVDVPFQFRRPLPPGHNLNLDSCRCIYLPTRSFPSFHSLDSFSVSFPFTGMFKVSRNARMVDEWSERLLRRSFQRGNLLVHDMGRSRVSALLHLFGCMEQKRDRQGSGFL